MGHWERAKPWACSRLRRHRQRMQAQRPEAPPRTACANGWLRIEEGAVLHGATSLVKHFLQVVRGSYPRLRLPVPCSSASTCRTARAAIFGTPIFRCSQQ